MNAVMDMLTDLITREFSEWNTYRLTKPLVSSKSEWLSEIVLNQLKAIQEEQLNAKNIATAAKSVLVVQKLITRLHNGHKMINRTDWDPYVPILSGLLTEIKSLYDKGVKVLKE